MPRWMHKIWAAFAGYFWLPCPECGRMFGGHEVRGPAYSGPQVFVPGVAIRKVLCPRCEPVVRKREWESVFGEGSWMR